MKNTIHEQLRKTNSRIRTLRLKLSNSTSPVGDWKGIKQREYIDAGRPAPYTESEMQKYYDDRLAIRQEINTLEASLPELEKLAMEEGEV